MSPSICLPWARPACGLAVLTGLVALLQIWRRGYAGAGKAAFGVVLPLLMLAWPLTFVPAFMNLPRINDVTTDVAAPPRFIALAKLRTAEANPVAYPGERFAEQQQKAYPDLRTFVLDRGVEEAYELVEEIVRKLKWKVAASDPPTVQAAQGRPAGGNGPDAGDRLSRRRRSCASRAAPPVRASTCAPPRATAMLDIGQNATRVRRFLAELQSRTDATGAPIRRPARAALDPHRRHGQESERARSAESGESQ